VGCVCVWGGGGCVHLPASFPRVCVCGSVSGGRIVVVPSPFCWGVCFGAGVTGPGCAAPVAAGALCPFRWSGLVPSLRQAPSCARPAEPMLHACHPSCIPGVRMHACMHACISLPSLHAALACWHDSARCMPVTHCTACLVCACTPAHAPVHMSICSLHALYAPACLHMLAYHGRRACAGCPAPTVEPRVGLVLTGAPGTRHPVVAPQLHSLPTTALSTRQHSQLLCLSACCFHNRTVSLVH
jgi:hypothetical protein